MQLLSVPDGLPRPSFGSGISRTLHGHGLGQLGTDFRAVYHDERISMVYFLSLTGKQMPDAAGNLAGDTVFGSLCLSLNYWSLRCGDNISGHADRYDYDQQCGYSGRQIVSFFWILVFMTSVFLI